MPTLHAENGTIFYSRSLYGILRQTSAGRLVIDDCASDAEHLAAATPAGVERRACQVDFVATLESLMNRRGHLKISITFDPNEPEPGGVEHAG
jgi:hypothetical protein